MNEVSKIKCGIFTNEVQWDANELIPGISMILEVLQEGIVFSQWLRILEQYRDRNKQLVHVSPFSTAMQLP